MPSSIPPQLNATDSLNIHVTSRCCSPIKRNSNAAYRVFVAELHAKKPDLTGISFLSAEL
jgi:hypothetical protein